MIIVGGGHNALVAAAYLGKAGLAPLVLERAERVGGCAAAGEISPGFRGPILAHTAAIDPAIVRGLRLEQHGLRVLRPEVAACAPTRDGRALILWADEERAAQSIAGWSAKDARSYSQFLASFAKISGVLRALTSVAPPSLDKPTGGDFIEVLKTGRRFRALGKADAYRLVRWMPMAVADLAGEWFESEPSARRSRPAASRVVSRAMVGRQRRPVDAARRQRRTSDRERLGGARRHERRRRRARTGGTHRGRRAADRR